MTDPVTAALITAGGGLLNTLIGAFDDTAEVEGQKNRDAQLKIAADNLGLNYAQLKQNADQFQQTQRQRIKEWAASNNIDIKSLSEKIRSAQANEKLAGQQLELTKQGQESQKQQFAISQANDPAVAKEQRMHELRKAFLGPSVPKTTGVPVPTSKTVTPTASTTNKALGSEALSQPTAA